MTQTVAILGATGSVGRQAMDVLHAMPERFRVVALSANSRWEALLTSVRRFSPQAVAICDEASGQFLKAQLPDGLPVFTGNNSAVQLLEEVAPDIVLVAIAGAAGLPATLAALRTAKRVALANKESIVIAGELIAAEANKHNAEVIPVDSEHSGVFQILHGARRQEVRTVYLTASGGPFLGYSRARLALVTPEEALTHPTWQMGEKITIDSATLMNKALEVLEAKWLFDLDASQIKVLIHPESIVHAIVEFLDGSVIGQMSVPDMRVPIQYAFTHPERSTSPECSFDPVRMANLHFREGAPAEFPALALAYDVLEAGGASAAVFSAANEVAVASFLQRKIAFTEIVATTRAVLDKHETAAIGGLDDLMEADRWARKEALNWVSCKT